jgi:hypothetical protein
MLQVFVAFQGNDGDKNHDIYDESFLGYQKRGYA